MVFEETKRWAQARMDPRTWERIARLTSASSTWVERSGAAFSRFSPAWSSLAGGTRSARSNLWTVLFSLVCALVPAFLIGLVDINGVVAIPILVLLLAVGLATYVTDWIGGATAAAASTICIDLLFLGERFAFDSLASGRSIATALTFVLTAAVVVSAIEFLKREGADARLEASALRAANTALSAVEIAAAQRPPGDREAYLNVLSAILTAMVRVNRASAGALYLVDDHASSLVRAAAYGDHGDDGGEAGESEIDIPIGHGFTGRIAQERRPISVYDVLEDPDVDDVMTTNRHVRSVTGVPLIDPADRLVGVAWVGLYLPYRFGPTSVARLTALANRTIAFMEAARLVDDQDELLDRVQDHYRRLQAVIQTIPEAVMVARPPNGVIVASNAAAQRMFGADLEGPAGTRRADHLRLIGPPDVTVEVPILRALREGVVITGVELSVRQADGSVIPVVASAAPVRTDDGSIDAVVGIFQDVSPLKEAERLRDEFISVVSHELRSPLTPIRGFAQVVARDLEREGGHDQHVTWLVNLQHHVDRITRLVDDLLDVSRLRAGRLKIVRADVELVDLCRSVVDSWNASSTRHQVMLQAAEEPLHAHVDRDRINQVLDNLVGNAVKYAVNGRITVSVEPAGEAVAISVIDEGPGIPDVDQEAVFTPFYRLRQASESAVPGLGLGLYISSEIIQQHDGTLQVAGTPAGGSRFTVTIPTG